jgi:hypothetical protein
MMSPVVRARLLGALLLVAAFGAGTLVGYLIPRREDDATLKVVVKATNRIPAEISALGLTDQQRTLVQGILLHGAARVRGVISEFEPRMSAAIDSTDIEIRAVLTVDQRASLDEERQKNPLRMIRREQIDTIRR